MGRVRGRRLLTQTRHGRAPRDARRQPRRPGHRRHARDPGCGVGGVRRRDPFPGWARPRRAVAGQVLAQLARRPGRGTCGDERRPLDTRNRVVDVDPAGGEMMAEPMRADFEARRAPPGQPRVSTRSTQPCPWSCARHATRPSTSTRSSTGSSRCGRAPGRRPATSTSHRGARRLDALLQGYRTQQIAMMLGISSHTVRKHLRSLYAKADCASQAELVSWARSRRVLP